MKNSILSLGLAVGLSLGLAVIKVEAQPAVGTGGTANAQSFYVVQSFPLPYNPTAAGGIYTTNIQSGATNLDQGWSTSVIYTNTGTYWSNNASPPQFFTYTNYTTNTTTTFARIGPIAAQNANLELYWTSPTATTASGFWLRVAKSSGGTLFDTNASSFAITNASYLTGTNTFNTNINLAGAGYVELSAFNTGTGSALSNLAAYLSWKKNTP